MRLAKLIPASFLLATGFTMLVAAKTRPLPLMTGEVCIFKFEDKNSNGVQDPGEPPMAGWNFTVSPGGPTVTTGPTGKACFSMVPGNYLISEQPQLGWGSVGPKHVHVIANHKTLVTFANTRVM